MNKNAIIIAVVVVIVALGAWFYFMPTTSAPANPTGPQNGSQNSQQNPNTPAPGTPAPGTPASPNPMDLNTPAPAKTFTVTGTNFSFSPSEIRVKKGDLVKIIFKPAAGTHNWTIDEFNSRTKILRAGDGETIEFVADKIGQFEYYCAVDSHRQMGMKGKLIVTE